MLGEASLNQQSISPFHLPRNFPGFLLSGLKFPSHDKLETETQSLEDYDRSAEIGPSFQSGEYP